jgi:hypothetical protein
MYARETAEEGWEAAEVAHLDRLRRHFTPGRGDLCEFCKANLVVEGEDFCRACLDDMEPTAA